MRQTRLQRLLFLAFLLSWLVSLSEITFFLMTSSRYILQQLQENHDAPLYSIPSKPPNNNIMIIATAVKTERNAVALWTELECLTKGMDQVILSAPLGTHQILNPIADQARRKLRLNIQTTYHVNDRYDAGLWCSALEGTKIGVNKNATTRYKHYVLINDSVAALRNYTGILQELHDKKFDLVGLSYSNLGSYWLESVVRGFTHDGVLTYMNHSCVDVTHVRYCRHLARRPLKYKRCIVENHEIAIAGLFGRNKITGLYPSEPSNHAKMWHANPTWWKNYLVKQRGFPVAKIKEGVGHVADLDSPLLANCTRHLDMQWIRELWNNATKS